MCEPNVPLKMVTDPSGNFRQISIHNVLVGDLVYVVCPAFHNLRAMCAKIINITPEEVTYTYQNRNRDTVKMPFIWFTDGQIKLYMELDYWTPRAALLKLEEGTRSSNVSNDHIERFLFDPMMMREITSYMPPVIKRPPHSNTGGKKHNKKSRKSRKSRKSKTFKNIN